MAKLQYGEPETWAVGERTGEGNDEFLNKIKPFLKISKDCSYNKPNCFPNVKYKSISGVEGSNMNEVTHSRIILNNGMLVSFYLNSEKCKYNTYVSDTNGDSPHFRNICGGLHVDVNGKKPPNTSGIDHFLLFVTKYGIIPAGSAEDTTEYSFARACKRNGTTHSSSSGCTAWVIFNGNMDYLRCDDLSWEGKLSCKR